MTSDEKTNTPLDVWCHTCHVDAGQLCRWGAVGELHTMRELGFKHRSFPCEAEIDLSKPIGFEKRRGYQPPWYTVFFYTCPRCDKRVNLRLVRDGRWTI